MCKLDFKTVLAKETREELMEGDDPMSDEQRDILQGGLKAEKIICNYYDSLVSYMNSVGKECWLRPIIHLCKKAFEEVMSDLSQDYVDIVSSVQKRSKCNSAYCLQVDKNRTQYCSFYYPFDESPATRIKYIKVSNIAGVSFRPEIVKKKNHPWLNRHQQLHPQGWRADMPVLNT